MKLVFLGGKPTLLEALKALGNDFTVVKGKPQPLCPKTLDWVYVVGASIADSEEWAQYRVSLAQTNRYYIVGSEVCTSARIVRAMRDGAYDVLTTDDDLERCRQAMFAAAKAQRLWWELYGSANNPDQSGLIGRSALMRSLRDSVQRVGPTMASVLIMGESGTGKERVAEAIHAASGRKPFITLNCAAIPPDLLESELFGADKGAYTGAAQPKPGLVEAASGGTLFLDEIGELGLSLQPKLLRFLETRRARRVGSTKENAFDVRIISATNRNLPIDAEQGRFRLDLFYRLCEIDVRTPPLRAHAEDIADLSLHFLTDASERFGRYFAAIEPELIEKFRQYNWPGNVRELRQTIERLVLHYDGPILRSSWWSPPQSGYPTMQAASLYPSPFPQQAFGAPAQYPPTAHPYPPTSGGFVLSQAMAAPPFGSPYPPAAPHASAQQNTPQGGGIPFAHSGSDAQAGIGAQSGISAQPLADGRSLQRLNKRERVELARQLLAQSGGDLTWTAAQLGIHPTTLFRWRKAGKL